ncbi:MAG: acyl-CoA thioesterase [Gammaproteobacteria bacterium]|nr:acyl-CoA thioesterase [Gammaproteobacteria bacterium]
MPKPAAVSVYVDLQVPFHDVDVMRITWHGHYVKYLEIARTALIDEIDYGYEEMENTGYGWPIVDMHLRYVRPARMGQWLRVYADLVEWENCMKIRYRIVDRESGTLLNKATSMQVAIDVSNNEMLFASPTVFLNKLRAYGVTIDAS